jgi:hypothetical protein
MFTDSRLPLRVPVSIFQTAGCDGCAPDDISVPRSERAAECAVVGFEHEMQACG